MTQQLFANDAPRPSIHSGVVMQIYPPAWGGGLLGIRERIGFLRWLGVAGVISSPVWEYRGKDGIYSPLVDIDGAVEVAEEFGGAEALRATNYALREAGITPIGDLVLNHISAWSPTWQRALAGDREAQACFRLTDDPVASGFARKVNIFGEPSYAWVPEIAQYIARTFYDDQIELDITHERVRAFLARSLFRMFDDFGYRGGRWDAIAYAGGRTIDTPAGEHGRDALYLAELLRSTVLDQRPGTIALAEAGGTRSQIAPWLQGHRCQWAYDFGYGPAVIAALHRGNWAPLDDYLANSPPINSDAAWVLFPRSHDELQLRYSEFREELIEEHGGPDGKYVVFGGNGINQRLRALMPNQDINAQVMVLGLTICLDGVPMLFQGDTEGRIGNVDAEERNPSRDPMPWVPEPPLFGWPEEPAQPFAPDAMQAAVSVQFKDPGSPLCRVRRFVLARNLLPALQHGARRDRRSSNPAVKVFARVTHGQGDVIVLANATGKRQRAEVDLHRWGNRRLCRLVTDPAAYAPSSVGLLWTEDLWLGWDESRHYQVELEPYELRILVPF